MSTAGVLAGLVPVAAKAFEEAIAATKRAKTAAAQVRLARAAAAAVVVEAASIEVARGLMRKKQALKRR